MAWNFLIFVVLLSFLNFSQTQDTCIDPFRRSGICVGIRTCPSLVKLLKGRVTVRERSVLRQSQCGWEGNYPKVCCADSTPVARNPSPGFTNSLTFPSDDETPVRRLTSSSLLPEIGKCGVQVSNKIFGGSQAQFDEYPWLALLEYLKPDRSRGVHCGGALINDRYVITAAHCIPSFSNSQYRLINVHLGEYDIRQDPDCDPEDPGNCADPLQVIPIEQELPHEGYNLQTLHNDIALLRLARKVQMSYYVKPICLPTDPTLQRSDITINQEFDVAGWGRTENGYKSPIKLKVRVKGVSNDKCGTTYGRSLSPKRIVPEQLCAGGERGKDSCNGDSGGPLMGYYKDSNGRAYFYLAGVVSFGPQECGLEGWPGVYTRVSRYIPWIQTKLRA